MKNHDQQSDEITIHYMANSSRHKHASACIVSMHNFNS